MSIKPSAKKNIIRISYIRLALVSIVTLLAMSACGLIDSIVISRHLDTRAVAAVGYYAPMNVLTDLIYVVGVGACLLCGNFIGSGQQSRVNSLFTTTFTVTFAYGALLCPCGLRGHIRDARGLFRPRQTVRIDVRHDFFKVQDNDQLVVFLYDAGRYSVFGV